MHEGLRVFNTQCHDCYFSDKCSFESNHKKGDPISLNVSIAFRE